MEYLWKFILCFLASVFFAVVFHSPARSVPVSALIGSLSFLVYLLLGENLWSYFFAALVIALLGEAAARVMKMPAPIFISSAVVPIVPGTGLYQTMLYLVEGSYQSALQIGAFSLLAMGSIAMAFATGSLLFRATLRRK